MHLLNILLICHDFECAFLCLIDICFQIAFYIYHGKCTALMLITVDREQALFLHKPCLHHHISTFTLPFPYPPPNCPRPLSSTPPLISCVSRTNLILISSHPYFEHFHILTMILELLKCPSSYYCKNCTYKVKSKFPITRSCTLVQDTRHSVILLGPATHKRC